MSSAQLGTLVTAMVTPFDTNGLVDSDVAVELMHELVDSGSDGIVVTGTTGESSTLTDHEQLELIHLAVEEVGDRCKVIAGTGSNDTRHAVELTTEATKLGVAGILSVTPYYNRPNRIGIVEHFKAVSSATDLPIILYNIPARTGTDMPNSLVEELAEIEGVAAVKQARDSDLQLIDGLDFYAGNDDMLCRAVELGAVGGICVASHIFGSQMREIIDSPETRQTVDAELREAYEVLSITTNPIPIKAALNLLGKNVGGLRLPLVPATEEENRAIESMLSKYGLL